MLVLDAWHMLAFMCTMGYAVITDLKEDQLDNLVDYEQIKHDLLFCLKIQVPAYSFGQDCTLWSKFFFHL